MLIFNLTFFQQCIDNLNIQIDTFESEIETLLARKKKLDRDVSINNVSSFN